MNPIIKYRRLTGYFGMPGWARASQPWQIANMDVHGYPWISMDEKGYPWISMDMHRYPWTSMDIHGCPWTSMDTHGYPWISLDIHAHPRISLDIHGHPWIGKMIPTGVGYVYSQSGIPSYSQPKEGGDNGQNTCISQQSRGQCIHFGIAQHRKRKGEISAVDEFMQQCELFNLRCSKSGPSTKN